VGCFFDLEAVALEYLGQAFARVMRDVLVAVAAGNQESIHRLDNAPSQGRVVRRADYQRPTRPQHAIDLAEQRLVVRDVLDHLRMDEAIEGFIPKRQRHRGAAHERNSAPAQEPELVKVDADANGVVEALHDHARAASDVQRAPGRASPEGGDPMAPALPEALNGYRAVEGA